MKLSHFFRSPTSWRQLIDRPSFHPLALPRPRPLLSANEWALQGWTWRHISVGLFLLECRTPTHIFGLRAPHLLAPNSLRLGCSLRLFLPILLPFPVLFPGPRLALSGDCPCYSYILPFLLSRLFFSKIFCMSNPILVFALERPELTWKQKGNYEVVLIARILSVKERRHNIVLKKIIILSLTCEMEVSLLIYEVFYLQISTMVPSDSVLWMFMTLCLPFHSPDSSCVTKRITWDDRMWLSRLDHKWYSGFCFILFDHLLWGKSAARS